MTTHHDNSSKMPTDLIEPLQRWAEDDPDRVIFTFVENEQETTLTYGELNRQAEAIGATLQDMGLEGERALLLYQPGLEYVMAFFGCLFAGVVAVPLKAPHRSRPDERFRAVARDASARVALTTAKLLAFCESSLRDSTGADGLRCITTEAIPEGAADGWRRPAADGDRLAFLQYTSGSTSAPRGVMVSHRNLLHNTAQIARRFGSSPERLGVSWLPHYHDMGLIGGIVQAAHVGLSVTLMSPLLFLQRPLAWLRTISRYQDREVISGGPNFAYDLCATRVSAEQKAGLNLRNWRVAFSGAEPVRHETLKRFAAAFEPCGFRPEVFCPSYGLAEATLFVSGGTPGVPPAVKTVQAHAIERHRVVEEPAQSQSARSLVSCGRGLNDQKIVIANPETKATCPPDEVGEIWVSGPSVAGGYWRRPAETEEVFNAFLSDTGEGPFLRTGDLGFLRDGELYVTGRFKDLIIIDGRNQYPTDIELTVERSHTAVRAGGCAAFAVEEGGQERLVIAAEVARHCADEELREVESAVRHEVAEAHDLRVHALLLLRRASIPRTSSGKIRRYACREAYLSGTLE